ncbi:twin-arginine translocase subunit TatB [Alphaproteobacteria bacterium HT1-32]|nr:twin-arginine translocase subunit TatB [Alphaproteobacteria bacterium HT1-32]
MFDIGWSEMMMIGVMAVIVIGPKDLPKALKTVGKWVRRARELAREFQSGVDDMVREADLEEAREAIRNTTSIDKKIEETVDPTGEMTKAMRDHGEDIRRDLERDETKAAETAKTAGTEAVTAKADPPAAATPAKADDTKPKTGTPG